MDDAFFNDQQYALWAGISMLPDLPEVARTCLTDPGCQAFVEGVKVLLYNQLTSNFRRFTTLIRIGRGLCSGLYVRATEQPLFGEAQL